MRKQYTVEQRERLIAAVRGSGERVSVVAKRMGVTPSSAYLSLKEPAPGASMLFARVVPARVATIRVQVGGAAVVVEAGFDAEFLRQVVAALSGTP